MYDVRRGSGCGFVRVRWGSGCWRVCVCVCDVGVGVGMCMGYGRCGCGCVGVSVGEGWGRAVSVTDFTLVIILYDREIRPIYKYCVVWYFQMHIVYHRQGYFVIKLREEKVCKKHAITCMFQSRI